MINDIGDSGLLSQMNDESGEHVNALSLADAAQGYVSMAWSSLPVVPAGCSAHYYHHSCLRVLLGKGNSW